MAVDYSKYHSILDSYEPYQPPAPVDQSAPKQNTSALGDFGTDLKRGLQQVPSAVTGLLDIPVAAVTGRPMVSEGWEGLGQITGFQPQKWSDEARAEYSPERQAAQQQAAQAEGFANTAGVYLSNPSLLAGTVLESVPSIALGGVYGRALRGVGALSGVTRGAIGEGAVMAGQSMNQMVEDGVDPRRAAAFATGVGVAGGALGAIGGSLTQRMGLVDVDTLAAGGARAAGVAAPGLLRRVAGGAVAEGAFEELPQTLVETSLGNLAADRPWDEDLGKNAAVGLLAGGLMGGVVNIPGARRQRDMTQAAPQGGEAAPVEPSALEAALRTDTMPVQQWVDQQLNIGASQAETRKNAKAAFEGSVEPTLILDENGAPRTTTSAFDVYEFNNAFDARMAKQAARGRGGVQEDTQTPQTPQTPQAVDEDPAVASLRGTQYANAIFKKDGAMRQNAERAWKAYSGFSGTEIDAALEELAPQPKAAWRIAMLESIRDARAQQAQPQGAPNVAQMDAASGQGAGAVPAGSAGVAPSGPVDLGRVDQPARASAPGSGAGVPVGSPVVQQPAGVAEGTPVQNVPPTQQVAQETQETGGQEVAQNPAAQSGVTPRQRPITSTAETAVLERAVDAQPTNLTEVQAEVYDYVVKAVQDGRIDEIVDAQGVLMHQNIARALGKKRGSIKSALTLVMPKIARAAGVSVDQMVSALRATRNKVAETAAETRLGLSPDAQPSVVEGEDVFGDDATMGVIESVGGSRQDLGEGANWQRLINQGVPFSKRPAEKSPGWTETTISEAVLSGELDADQQQAAEQELISRETRRLSRERSADEPTVDAKAVGQAPAAGRRADEAVERLAEQERLAQEVEERRALEAKARRALLEAEMEWANLAGEIELAELNWDSTVEDRTNRIRAPKFAELPPEAQHEFALVSRLYEDGGIDETTLVSEVRAIAEEVRSNANTQTAQPAAGGGNAQIAQGVPRLAVERAESPRAEGAGQETGTGEEVAARGVGRTAAREYAAAALTRLQQYYDTPNLAALASRLENASDLASLDSELDTDQEWEQDFNLSNSLEKVRRDAAAIERLAAAHPEAFELGYLRAQDYGGFASDTPVSELISHMSIASVRPSAEFGSPRDYYVQRDAQASEGVNQIDSRTLGVGDGNRFSRTADTQGTTVESVRSAINDIATPAGKRKITVVQSADELVEMGVLKSSQARGTQGYVTRSGDAFFIADNIRPGNELAVVLHEIGAHLGIEKLLTDKQYETLVKKIFDWAASDANTQEARIARAAIRRVAQANIENEADLSPETIAYFIEEAVKAGVNPTAMQYKTELGRWFRTLWAAFKVALDRLGLINADKLTAQNVVDLAYGAANLELTGVLDGETDSDVRFSKAADPQLVELAQESGQRALKAIQAGIRRGWTGLAFSSHLANAAHRAGLTSARALELVQRKKATRAYEIQIEVEKVLSKFAGLKGKIGGKDAGVVVQEFIYDSTFNKKWGFKPDWKDNATIDPDMERRFNALPTEAKDVIKDVFRHGDTIFREKQALLRKTITGEYEALIKAETDDGKRRKLERQRDKELREAGRLIAEMNGPYAPLRRYGSYVVVAKSQKYRDMEAAGPVDAETKANPKHYVVEFAETLFEAEKMQAELEAEFGKGMVWSGEKEASTQQFGELPFMAVQRLRKMVDTDLDGELNTKSKRVLNKLLVDLYISTLHEANARHSEQKRHFVAGASKEMMRAFATQGRADSHLVSALQFNAEIVDEMQKLRNEAKNGQGDSLLKTRLRNEILQRHMMDLDFRETPVQDKLMSLNSFWMLLTSPGYYVQNATQIMMMTQPVLAGKFGQGRSMRQLMRGYQDAVRVLKGSSWNEAANLAGFNGTADEKAMLTELQARGTLDFGISAELGYWETRGEVSKVFNQVMRKVGMATRKLEVLNRMSSSLAAYRLMYDQTSGTQAARHAAALEYADSIIKDTHGDYSTANAPRYLRMLPKVMTQFRKFQLIQLSLFAKVIHGSVKGATAQERAAMRAALGYLFMNHAVLAGAVGVPASALLGAIYAAAGDDDDPNDWEVDVRRAIGDKDLANLILHGLPSLVNVNMSNKIGAGTMLDPLPFVEYEATRGGYEKAVTAAMGPLIGGLGAQAVDGIGRILNGDVAQGTAQLLPRGFRDAARGFMAAQDGIKLRNGQTALTPEELSFYDSLMMGLGLPTMKTTGRTETQFKTQQYEKFFRERVTKLKRQYSEAYEENDREAMLEARQAWGEMQASRKNLGFKVQPLSELLKAPREKAKAEAKLQGGVRTTEQARGFVQSLQ